MPPPLKILYPMVGNGKGTPIHPSPPNNLGNISQWNVMVPHNSISSEPIFRTICQTVAALLMASWDRICPALTSFSSRGQIMNCQTVTALTSRARITICQTRTRLAGTEFQFVRLWLPFLLQNCQVVTALSRGDQIISGKSDWPSYEGPKYNMSGYNCPDHRVNHLFEMKLILQHEHNNPVSAL